MTTDTITRRGNTIKVKDYFLYNPGIYLGYTDLVIKLHKSEGYVELIGVYHDGSKEPLTDGEVDNFDTEHILDVAHYLLQQ